MVVTGEGEGSEKDLPKPVAIKLSDLTKNEAVLEPISTRSFFSRRSRGTFGDHPKLGKLLAVTAFSWMIDLARLPLYFSETLTVGQRTYLMEVRKDRRGRKYFIIKRTDLRDEEQTPVIVYPSAMIRFAGAIERATKAMMNSVGEVESADERKARREQSKKATAARKEKKKKRFNQGKRWTEEHDSLLIVHYKNGMPIEELAEMLGRGEVSVSVRLMKLGIMPPPTT